MTDALISGDTTAEELLARLDALEAEHRAAVAAHEAAQAETARVADRLRRMEAAKARRPRRRKPALANAVAGDAPADDGPPAEMSRRGLLGAVGKAAAAGVGLAAVSSVVAASPAAADFGQGGFGNTNGATGAFESGDELVAGERNLASNGDATELNSVLTASYVFGSINSATQNSTGLYGEVGEDVSTGTAVKGRGVYGHAKGDDATIGVYGEGRNSARGVYGSAIANDGVYGSANTGFVGVHGSSGSSAGVAHVAGVMGESAGDDGVAGITRGTGKSGIYGQNQGSGAGFGVYGVTLGAGIGVRGGTAAGGSGVYGVAGQSTGVDHKGGVVGDNAAGDGVVGLASASDKSGVFGENTGTGTGVYGLADGVGVGVHGGAAAGGIGVQGAVSSGVGVRGQLGNSTNTGVTAAVLGDSAAGNGVAGVSSASSGAGVFGSSTGVGFNAYAVSGIHQGNGTGVAGLSRGTGYGVTGDSTNGVGGHFSGALANLLLPALRGAAGAPTTGDHSAGEIYMDGSYSVWVCTVAGTPGTWSKISYGGSSASGGYTPITPTRIADTRPGFPPNTNNDQPLNPGQELVVPVVGTAGVPATATAVMLNMSALNVSLPQAFLSVYPADDSHTLSNLPPTANITPPQGTQATCNLVCVKLGVAGAAKGNVKIFNFKGTVDFIFDVNGYFS